MFKIIPGFWALNGQGSQVQIFFFFQAASKRGNHVNICHRRAPLAKSSNRPAPCVIRLVKLSLAQTPIEEGTLSIWMQAVLAAATSSCFYWFFCPQLYNRSSVLDLNLNHIVGEQTCPINQESILIHMKKDFYWLHFAAPLERFTWLLSECAIPKRMSVGFFLCVSGDWTKDKEALTQNFECAVQQATTQALTNLFSKAFGLVLPVHCWLF